MFLKGHTVAIRALEPSDAEVLYKWENNRELWPVSLTQIPFSRFTLEEFVNAAHNDIYTNKQLRLMVDAADGKATIGTVDLFEFEPQHARCGIGIYIHGDHRRNGCASECIELVKNYCFTTLLLKQVYVHVNSSNTASLALFEKAGFEKNGFKKCWHRSGLSSYEDVWFMQLINDAE